MNAQDVANTVWALATLGWQAGEGAMRCALEGAAVRVAPSMKPWQVASTLWQAGNDAMRLALEDKAFRAAPRMNSKDVLNTLWALATLGWQPGCELLCSLEEAAERLRRFGRGRCVSSVDKLLWLMQRLPRVRTCPPVLLGSESSPESMDGVGAPTDEAVGIDTAVNGWGWLLQSLQLELEQQGMTRNHLIAQTLRRLARMGGHRSRMRCERRWRARRCERQRG